MALVDAETGKTVSPSASEGKKPGIQAKDRPDIPADQFVVSVPSEENRAAFRRRREERTEQQQNVDKLVYDMYQDWIKAGRPVNWSDVPIRVWTLDVKHEENAMFMIRKACRLHGRKPWFGHIEHKTVDGKKVVSIPFGITSTTARMKSKPASEGDNE